MVTVRVGKLGVEPPDVGYRVLVDRLWPRGVPKVNALWDEWLPGAAPSAALRRWYGHRPERYGEFRARYLDELSARGGDPALARLRELAQRGPLMLLTATRRVSESHVPVLAEYLTPIPDPAAPPFPAPVSEARGDPPPVR